MKKAFALIASLIALTNFAHAANHLDVVQKINDLVAPGSYEGVTVDGEGCHIALSDHGNQSYSISMTQDSFVFGEEDGSSECMNSKTCFVVSPGTKVKTLQATDNSIFASIKKKGGGPDLAPAKKMELSMVRTGNKLNVEISESIGFMGLSEVSQACSFDL